MIELDVNGQVQEYTIILSRRDHTHLGQIYGCQEVEYLKNLNGADEITFYVNKYSEEEISRYSEVEQNQIKMIWDELTDFKFIFVKELNEYFEIQVPTDEEDVIIKSVSGISACEAELGQINLYGLEINTEADIARKDYTSPTVFYDSLNPNCSLLNRVLSKAPHYSIGHVDSSLLKIQRTFSTDDEDIYSFLTDTVANEIGCLFQFNSVNRTISVYDLKNFCTKCGYRGDYFEECPKCHSLDIQTYGNDTSVLVDTENLAESINFTVDKDSVKNCFKLVAGDDNMTAAIVNRNPNGSSYLYYFSDDQKKEMPNKLVKKLDEYDKMVASYDKEYGTLIEGIYEDIDRILYYTSGMMPKIEHTPTNAEKEAQKLTEINLSPLGMSKLTDATSITTINNALKTYAKAIIKSGWFKAEINESNWSYVGKDSSKNNYGTWRGNFKVVNYSDEEDTAISPTISVVVNDDYKTFLEQKIEKNIKNNDEDGSVFDVLSIKELTPFKEAIKLYGLNRLKSFMDAISSCIDIMIESDQANENAELYNALYVPYLDKLKAVQDEMNVRQKTIDEWQAKLDNAQKRQRQIQKELDFEKYLGKDMYKVFCCYKREQTYSNDNYISEKLDNKKIFENAGAFLESAKEELFKSGEYQHQISGELYNLLAMPEFEPLKDGFNVGDFIRIKVDKKIYKLRIVQIKVMFDKIQHIDVEFSDVLKLRNGFSDQKSILDKASSMSTSYGAIANQVKNSKEQTDLIKDFAEQGFNATAMKIVNNAESQDITFGKSGLLAKRKDEFTETDDPYQVKLLNTGVYVTDNTWRTVKSCIGKYVYTDPKTGEEKIGFGLLADTIVGKLLLGNQLEIYSSDASSEMSFSNFGLRLNAKKTPSGQYKRIIDIQKDGESILYMDNKGNIVLASDQFIEMIEKLDRINVKYLDAENLYAKHGTIVDLNSEFAKLDNLEAPIGKITALTSGTIEAATAHFTGNIQTDLKILAAQGQIDMLTSTSANIGELTSFRSTLENLNATIGNIQTIVSKSITTDELNVTNISISELRVAKATITNLIAKIATIETLNASISTIDNLTVTEENAETIIANLGKFKKLNADLGNITELNSNVAKLNQSTIQALTAINGSIDSLTSTLATIKTLNSTTINVDNLTAKNAKIESLDSALGDFEEIKAQLANIENILAGNIGVGTLQAIHLTAKNVVIDKAVITDLIAGQMQVADLKAGDISTNRFTIKSEDGKTKIKDNTIQINDGTRTRVQIGKDAQNDYNMYVWDKKGNIMFDALGLTEDGVQRPIIRDEAVMDNANINGSKLNINSVITKINEDGTSSIKANKIWIDEHNQSLGASFNEIKTDVTDIKNKKMYRLEIISSNGVLFKNNNISTTLKAKVWSWDEDVTDTIPESCFIWTRNSDDKEQDLYWNNEYGKGKKQITITREDVVGHATFSCELNI